MTIMLLYPHRDLPSMALPWWSNRLRNPTAHHWSFVWRSWAPTQCKDRLSRYGSLMLKIRRSRDRLIFTTGIPMEVIWHHFIERPPVCDDFGSLFYGIDDGSSAGKWLQNYCDVIMDTVASQITSLTIVYSTVYSDADQRKHQSSASLAFVRGIHRDRWIPRTKGQ